jgi:hypothetical protein
VSTAHLTCCKLVQYLLEDLKGLETSLIMVLEALGQAQERRNSQQDVNPSNLTVLLQVSYLIQTYLIWQYIFVLLLGIRHLAVGPQDRLFPLCSEYYKLCTSGQLLII